METLLDHGADVYGKIWYSGKEEGGIVWPKIYVFKFIDVYLCVATLHFSRLN